jgi:hypothetical protein
VLDGADFAGGQFTANREHDGGGRIGALAAEQLALGQHQMHAGRLDAGQGRDGAGQLAFERTHVVDVLHEAGGAQRRLLVEDLVADLAALRQARTGQRHAGGGDLVARDENGVAVTAQFEGNVERLQFGHNCRRVFEAETGIERRQIRGLRPHHEVAEKAEHEQGDDRHSGQSRQAYAVDQLGKVIHAGTRLKENHADATRVMAAGQKLPS